MKDITTRFSGKVGPLGYIETLCERLAAGKFDRYTVAELQEVEYNLKEAYALLDGNQDPEVIEQCYRAVLGLTHLQVARAKADQKKFAQTPEITYQELEVSETELLATEAVISEVEENLSQHRYRYDSYTPVDLEALADDLRTRYNSLAEDLKDMYCDRYFEAVQNVRDLANTKGFADYLIEVQVDLHLGKFDRSTLAELEEIEHSLTEGYSKLPAFVKETFLDDCAEVIAELTDLQNDTIEKSVEELLNDYFIGDRENNAPQEEVSSIKADDIQDTVEYSVQKLLEEHEERKAKISPSGSASFSAFSTVYVPRNTTEIFPEDNDVRITRTHWYDYVIEGLVVDEEARRILNDFVLDETPAVNLYEEDAAEKVIVAELSQRQPHLVSAYAPEPGKPLKRNRMLNYVVGTALGAVASLAAVVGYNYVTSPTEADTSVEPYNLPAASVEAAPKDILSLETYVRPHFTQPVSAEKSVEEKLPVHLYTSSAPRKFQAANPSLEKVVEPVDIYAELDRPLEDIYAGLDLPREDIYAELDAPQEDIYAELETEPPQEDIYAAVDRWNDYRLKGGILSFEEYDNAVKRAHQH